jgi:N-acetylglutamate synthase-like GNAT family acetyltransferase
MIRKCLSSEFCEIYTIINDAAQAYKGLIPTECWNEPYMSKSHLEDQINDGVTFYGWEENGQLIGVMGIQDKVEVTLIRHAYVCTVSRNKGIGGQLLNFLSQKTEKPILIGTWRAAIWAISFYQKNGYCLVDEKKKTDLLNMHWNISKIQEENSVVLSNIKY